MSILAFNIQFTQEEKVYLTIFFGQALIRSNYLMKIRIHEFNGNVDIGEFCS